MPDDEAEARKRERDALDRLASVEIDGCFAVVALVDIGPDAMAVVRVIEDHDKGRPDLVGAVLAALAEDIRRDVIANAVLDQLRN